MDSWDPSLSGDGNLVAFVSAAHNLAANDNNDMVDAFVHNRTTGVTTRVSLELITRAYDGSGSDWLSVSR
ncbi:MAG: hypothetical protein IPH95_16125 [Candidatus Promineofilum sp.]|nr:hypothetical protein [Promineifilum sp.]